MKQEGDGDGPGGTRDRFMPTSQSARERASAEWYIESVSAEGRSLPSAARMDASLSADSHNRCIGPR